VAWFIRDVFSRDTQLAMASKGSARYCFLYINGMFWGIITRTERAERRLGRRIGAAAGNNYDVIKVEAGPYTINATDGNMDAWTQLL